MSNRQDSKDRAAPLGAHVSAAGGLSRAPERAVAIEADAIQLFTKQPQRWAERAVDEEEAAGFREALAASGVRVAGAHDSYLINLASPVPALFQRSERSFGAELARCVALELDFLVTHPGNATDGDRRAALRRNARAIGAALEAVPGRTEVLLETTAGSGSVLGWRFEELAELLEAIADRARDRIGVCLDTAHVHAAGYDLRDDCGGMLDAFDRHLGLERLRLLHLNDSKAALGSRVDRHAHIGEGALGEEAFAALLRDPRVAHIPRVIETPKGKPAQWEANDRRNLATLRRLSAV